MSASRLEDLLLLQIRAVRLPMPEREVAVIPGRRFRADFCWSARRVVCEVEGGVWTGGRHGRGAGYTADCEKYSLMAIAGWTVIRVTAEHIRSGQALNWIVAALAVAPESTGASATPSYLTSSAVSRRKPGKRTPEGRNGA